MTRSIAALLIAVAQIIAATALEISGCNPIDQVFLGGLFGSVAIYYAGKRASSASAGEGE
jgi:hypothetical protein